MKKYEVIGTCLNDDGKSKKLECIVNASNKDEAVNIIDTFFRAFKFDETKVRKVK